MYCRSGLRATTVVTMQRLLRTRFAAWWFCTPLAGWLSRHILWRIDPLLMRLTSGRVGSSLLLPTALLETHGARTGRPRRNVVIYFRDGADMIVVASKLGAPDHPAWLYNARAHPDVRLGGRSYHARVVEDPGELARLWAVADAVFPVYAAYRAKAARRGRTIPILRLVAS
jgi:deazaflavin-dependent oxidoreductase (nitroreductase family)